MPLAANLSILTFLSRNKRATTVYPAEPADGIQILSITYAGDNITDEKILKRFFKAIRRHAEIEINDRTLDWEAMNPYATSFYPRREFVIEYLDSRQGPSYIKRRSMTGEQGMSLDFSWEIFSAAWGDIPGLNKRALTNSPGVFQSMFEAIDKDTWMYATCDNIQFDPAPGRLKVLQLTYGCHGGPIHTVAIPEHQVFRAKYRWDQKFIEKRASFIAPEMKQIPRPIVSRPSLKDNRRISWRADRPLSWSSAKPMLLKTA